MNRHNLAPMLAAGAGNVGLTKYLIGQVLQSRWSRILALREYMPSAKMRDWYLEVAGQRVQVIKKDAAKGGILQFGNEVVAAGDGSLACLLGASPGASTAVSIMLEIWDDEKPAARNLKPALIAPVISSAPPAETKPVAKKPVAPAAPLVDKPATHPPA